MNIFTSNTRALPYIQIGLTILVGIFCLLVPQSLLGWGISVLIYTLIGCLGISIGYHRLLTHKSFKTSKFWERICTAFGALAFTGSSIGWVGMHRQHHKYSDKSGDPHSPSVQGTKMLVASYDFDPNKWTVRYLITDKFHTILHKYYFAILLAWIAFFSLFGVSTLFYVVLIPAMISIWVSTISNYVNHKWGYRNFKTSDESRNLWINAIFTFGEGWHNNHHAQPGNYSFKVKWWELDAGGAIIKLIKK
jgi:fatty-acid desaturase